MSEQLTAAAIEELSRRFKSDPSLTLNPDVAVFAKEKTVPEHLFDLLRSGSSEVKVELRIVHNGKDYRRAFIADPEVANRYPGEVEYLWRKLVASVMATAKEDIPKENTNE